MKDKLIIKKALSLVSLKGFTFCKWVVWIPDRDEFLGVYDVSDFVVKKAWGITPESALSLGSSTKALSISAGCSGRSSGALAAMVFENDTKYHVIPLDSILNDIHDYGSTELN